MSFKERLSSITKGDSNVCDYLRSIRSIGDDLALTYWSFPCTYLLVIYWSFCWWYWSCHYDPKSALVIKLF